MRSATIAQAVLAPHCKEPPTRASFMLYPDSPDPPSICASTEKAPQMSGSQIKAALMRLAPARP